MKKLLLLFLIPFLIGAAPSRQNTYTPNTTIASDDVTANEDAIFNYLQAGVDTYKDDTIVNADIKTTANIQSDKLNLTSIAQDVAITSAGSFDNNGTTTLDGTFTCTNDVTLGDGTDDTLTINTDDGITFTPAMTWTFTGNQTVSGTWADAGIMTTVDINGGTLDDVQIDGATTTGTIWYNDASDNAFSLVPGADNQVLTSTGTSSAPAWEAGGSFIFIESNAISAGSTSSSITETISEGDVYLIIFEGVEDAAAEWEPGIRINADSTGDNYGYFLTGVTWDGASTVTAITEGDTTANEIPIIETGALLAANNPFLIRLYITARGSDTQIEWTLSSIRDSVASDFTEGVGFYDAATPTSISLNRISGTGTFVGRNYVFKLNTGT